jgi:hypothetical protein
VIGSIVVSEPKKITEGELKGMYVCQIYLPDQNKTCHPIYDGESAKKLLETANEFVRTYLKRKINRIEKLLNEKDVRKKLVEELD